MKFKEKIKIFMVAFLMLLFSYSLCSTHERPTSGYVSRRKIFCSTPLYIFVILLFILIFVFNIYS